VARSSPTTAIQRIVGDRLAQARQTAGKSQEQAASDAGIYYKRWQRLESGAVNATIKTLHGAAQSVGISFWDLCAVDGPPAGVAKRLKKTT
jgi:transcriptional regulator with XRE-family HTH domain